jgi:S-formylglutathione hydrolase FrmB
MKTLFVIISLLLFGTNRAAVVDTVSIYSKAMNKTRKCIVIRPFIPQQKPIPLPTVYLLHGFSGDYSNWILKVPQLREYVDTYQVIIVCPDGEYSSWYLDSPVDKMMKYETYIAEEVPEFIDSVYLTIHDRRARAITGLSMGGYGALFLGTRHSNIFGACGSISGGVDLRSSRNKYDLSKRIGDTLKNKKNWDDYSLINRVDKFPKDSLAIIFDCGVDDQFYNDNKKLHEKMVQLKIAHDYSERPGGHTWNYWANSIKYQLLFFRSYFDQPKNNRR